MTDSYAPATFGAMEFTEIAHVYRDLFRQPRKSDWQIANTFFYKLRNETVLQGMLPCARQVPVIGLSDKRGKSDAYRDESHVGTLTGLARGVVVYEDREYSDINGLLVRVADQGRDYFRVRSFAHAWGEATSLVGSYAGFSRHTRSIEDRDVFYVHANRDDSHYSLLEPHWWDLIRRHLDQWLPV